MIIVGRYLFRNTAFVEQGYIEEIYNYKISINTMLN